MNTILDKNKILCEFLGIQYEVFIWKDIEMLVPKGWRIDHDLITYKFDTDWNLLIKAFIKFKNLTDIPEKYLKIWELNCANNDLVITTYDIKRCFIQISCVVEWYNHSRNCY